MVNFKFNLESPNSKFSVLFINSVEDNGYSKEPSLLLLKVIHFNKLWLCESKELGFHLKGDIIKEINFIMYQSVFCCR